MPLILPPEIPPAVWSKVGEQLKPTDEFSKSMEESWVAIRWDPHWKAIYGQMRDDGKAANTAIIAVDRRLLVRINAMMKTGTSYQT